MNQFSCIDSAKNKQVQLPEILIVNQEFNWLFDCSEPVVVREFIISKKESQRIGSFFTGYFEIGENLLLVDRRMSNLNCINEKGEVIWFLKPPTPGLDKYNNIGSVEVDALLEEIYVEDRSSNLKIDVFSFSGEYLRSISSPIPFMDFAVISANNRIYDVAQSSQEAVSNGSSTVMRYLFQSNDELTLSAPIGEDFDLEAIPFNGYNRFSKVGNKLYHRMPFEDIVYRIENEEASPYFRIGFKFNSQFSEIGKEKSIVNKMGFIFDEGAPFPLEVVYDEVSRRTFVIFTQGTKSFLTLDVGGEQVISPARNYIFNDLVLPAPRYYQDGKFYLQMYRYHFNFLQQHYEDGTFDQETMEIAFKDLYNKIGDDDDILVFSLDFTNL